MAGEALTENRLGACSSPYLQQHADNPVAWQPWDEQALRLARDLDRPILLSIGYSACHWCHVMAHESFEDPDLAEQMNRLFVPIKVDREERPDLDQIYQLAHQLMNRRGGGWPLTAFLSPDQKPFFIATYFPREPKFGMPGLGEVLEKVAAFYRENGEAAAQNGDAVVDGLRRIAPAGGEALDSQVVQRLRGDLDGDYDRTNGGWGGAPKFPHAGETAFCLRREALDGDRAAGRMALHGLRAMVDGGLYDHLGGGFFRYCVDAHWTIPHFEKMLYDNAQLLGVLGDAYAHTGETRFAEAARETVDWLEREMRLPQGGFHATLDADSDGVEGGYYVWPYEEIAELLDETELAVAGRVYSLSRSGNFEGRNHLKRTRDPEDAAEESDLTPEQARRVLATARNRLFQARQERVYPGRDDKILSAWNGLLIGGLARAGRGTGAARYGELARGAVDFLRDNLWIDGRLLAVHKDGTAHQPAYLEDHAFLLNGLLDLLRWQWRDTDLSFARDLAETLLERFEDPADGGFFMTAHDHEALIHRPKPGLDQSLPSGNGAAAQALLELGHLLGAPRYLEAAERTLRLFMPEMKAHPGAYVALITALEEAVAPPTLVTLRGGETAREWQAAAQSGYHPRRRIYCIPDGARDLPGALAERINRAEVTAYICRGTECSAPITEWSAFEQALAGEA
ncbi:thioredoxin domain-containing protein [Thiohalorhabdus sp. Cl-TMA]|uniref:Thioredoxin domain-containing protein n=1 Tax=Thiohalorhabdus methylotrophus TaxID=3242694 RepID=A0ABV4TZB6_9GAMM